MSDLNTLLDMGFPQKKAEKALLETGYQGVEPAMEWLLAHSDDVEVDEPTQNVAPTSSDTHSGDFKHENEGDSFTADDNGIEPKVQVTINEGSCTETKSIKCEDCGKNFRTYSEIEFHAIKSGHQSFSQSSEEVKPLSEEEKQAQVKKIENLIKQRRAEKAEQEKRDALEREKNRRKAGQELTYARQKLQEEEIRNLAEMKRKEKLEAKLARQKVLEEIERDKQARREKFGMSTTTSTTPSTPAMPATTTTTNTKSYDECRLQIRLTNGSCLTQTFKPNEELAAVRLYVEMNRTDGSGPFNLMTTFPKRIFDESNMNSTLDSLGLVPSAVLIVSKR